MRYNFSSDTGEFQPDDIERIYMDIAEDDMDKIYDAKKAIVAQIQQLAAYLCIPHADMIEEIARMQEAFDDIFYAEYMKAFKQSKSGERPAYIPDVFKTVLRVLTNPATRKTMGLED